MLMQQQERHGTDGKEVKVEKRGRLDYKETLNERQKTFVE